jgi:primosomal protein N' (replication factor Y)
MTTDLAILQVAIDAPLRALFDYLPPPDVPASAIPVGSRVRVPFGRTEAVGMVVGGHAGPSALPASALKRIHALLDTAALLDGDLMRLLHWSAEYYHHPPGEVIAAALPKALRLGAPADLVLKRWRLCPAGEAALAAGTLARAPAQRALLQLLGAHGAGLTGPELAAALPAWRSHARGLAQRGWIECYDAAKAEPEAGPGPGGPRPDLAPGPRADAPALSAAQAAAVQQIEAATDRYAAFVLQGATGSGKTEVYLQCAARALARGRTALVLVPEIALTPQSVERFRAALPAPVAVLHSGLGDAARLAAWRAARDGQAGVVLGTRSAVFAPLPRLGLIIVDEEHDASYKQQDSGCRYSARDLAVVRARQAGIPIVLGSATPAFETLHNQRAGRYVSLALPRRGDQAAAPLLKLIDLRAHAVHQGLSTPVIDAIRRHLAAQGQVLVFINRRGYAPTLLCTACGWIAPCRQCDARMTVHRAGGQLACHHCGAAEPLPARCPRCGHTVKPVGQGTERVEETLRELFPEHALLRLDRDTAARPEQLEHIVRRVQDGEARILVGTQMVTKGHHFPGVLLVVVLNADHGLFSTDFRAAERLAQTIVQVAGRAGRERAQGEVLIQTEYPEHPLLQSLLAGGYEGFADTALAERAAARWPPFGRLAVLRASSTTADGALQFLTRARAAAPAAAADVRLLGPVPAAIARRAGRYYAQLLLESAQRTALHRFIDAWLPAVETLARAARVRHALDIDPIDIG